jgi:hypothetical protein
MQFYLFKLLVILGNLRDFKLLRLCCNDMLYILKNNNGKGFKFWRERERDGCNFSMIMDVHVL